VRRTALFPYGGTAAAVRQPGDLTMESLEKIKVDVVRSSRVETTTYDPRTGTTLVVERDADGRVLASRRFERSETPAAASNLGPLPGDRWPASANGRIGPTGAEKKRPELRVAGAPSGRAAPALGEEAV
jgi:hypothetical protein